MVYLTNYILTVAISVLAPESPGNIHTTVLTPNSSYPSVANVTLSVTWDPPQHITTPGEIIKYIIEWRKEPPTHAGHRLSPDHGLVQLNSVSFIHWFVSWFFIVCMIFLIVIFLGGGVVLCSTKYHNWDRFEVMIPRILCKATSL